MKLSNVAVGESPLFYCNKRMSVIGKDAIVAKINEIAERVADPEGIEIVELGTILDVEDVIPGDSYTLEVSSPGLERKLFKPKDFERFVGQKAKVVLREPVENQRRWEGKLAGIAEGIVALEPSAGKVIHFPLTQIEKANLKFEW